MENIKVVNIIPHPPAYNYLETGKKLTITFEQEDGTWCGFDTWDWADNVGAEVLKLKHDIQYEVWQPDLNAQKIYEYKCDTGVTRKLFPAKEINYKFKYGRKNIIFSEYMLNTLEEYSRNKFILNLNSWRDGFSEILFKKFYSNKNIKIYVTGHGGQDTALHQIKITHNPIKCISLIREHIYLKNLIKRIDLWTDQNDYYINSLKKYSKREIFRLTMGIDFNFWKPVKSLSIKNELRNKLGFNKDAYIMFSGCNLVENKQIDKFIKILNKIEKNFNFNFIYLVAGRGEERYIEHLKKIGNNLIKNKKFIIEDYKTGENLLDLYQMSDLYISVSRKEGASVAVMKAFATGLPVFTTDTGGTYDLMKENNIPTIVRKFNYSEWYRKLINILKNKPETHIPIEIAKKNYDWKNIAEIFLNIYLKLISK